MDMNFQQIQDKLNKLLINTSETISKVVKVERGILGELPESTVLKEIAMIKRVLHK